MSISDEERVSVEVEGFDPEMKETNNGKDFVIVMHYCQEYEDGEVEEKRMKFTLNWEGLNPQSLFNDYDMTVFGWLDTLDVHDDFARGTVVDRTLLSLQELLEEMRKENLSRPSHLGLKITIKVFEDDDAIEVEPEYYVHATYVEFVDENEYVLQGGNNTVDESEIEPEYFEDDEELVGEVTYPQQVMMDIEEENEQVAVRTLIYRGVSFFKLPEVSSLVHGIICPICLEEFGGDHHDKDMMEYKEDDEEVARLPCQHVLHTDCLIDWFVRCGDVLSCPLCRYRLRVLIV